METNKEDLIKKLRPFLKKDIAIKEGIDNRKELLNLLSSINTDDNKELIRSLKVEVKTSLEFWGGSEYQEIEDYEDVSWNRFIDRILNEYLGK